eukprot:scaffold2210_cov316-Pinguiococcus_pyrenoidosus.AAC.5
MMPQTGEKANVNSWLEPSDYNSSLPSAFSPACTSEACGTLAACSEGFAMFLRASASAAFFCDPSQSDSTSSRRSSSAGILSSCSIHLSRKLPGQGARFGFILSLAGNMKKDTVQW